MREVWNDPENHTEVGGTDTVSMIAEIGGCRDPC